MAVGAYEAARKMMVPDWGRAFDNARAVFDLERVAGFAWEQSLQTAFLGVPDLVQAMNVFYFVGHFLFTGIFFFWLYHRSRDGFRLFRNAFLVATGPVGVRALAVPDRAAAASRTWGSRTRCWRCPGSTSGRRTRARSRTRSRRCRACTRRTRSASASAWWSTAVAGAAHRRALYPPAVVLTRS